MFERYTEKARRVIFFARYEASQFGAHAFEPEHVLLGLLREDKLLAQSIFKTPHATPLAIRKAIEAATPTLNKVSASVDLPLSAACKRVLSYALDESDRLEHRHIGTEHLLLGILREGQSLAARVLADHGVTSEKVVAALKEQAEQPQDAAPSSQPMHGGGSGVAATLDPMMLQLAQAFIALVRLLIDRGIITPDDGVVVHRQGVNRFDEGRAGFGWSFTRISFTALLDVLAGKGVISEEEKQQILETRS